MRRSCCLIRTLIKASAGLHTGCSTFQQGFQILFSDSSSLLDYQRNCLSTFPVCLPCVQDSDAIEAARNCKLPDAILSLAGLTDDWAKTAADRLDSCSKGTGIPTASQVTW